MKIGPRLLMLITCALMESPYDKFASSVYFSSGTFSLCFFVTCSICFVTCYLMFYMYIRLLMKMLIVLLGTSHSECLFQRKATHQRLERNKPTNWFGGQLFEESMKKFFAQ